MKYTGLFKNINDEPYTVNITTNNDTSTIKEIVLGRNPFVVSTKSEGLYSTLKLREATITIVNDRYLFDIYSSTAHGTKVEVYNGADDVVFMGYITPNAYSQGYSSYLEEIEVQAVDGISTLEYFNYETDVKTIVSFLSIIDKCLAKCNCYSTVIYPKSMRLNETDSGDFLSQLYINENNFFDDDSEQSAWKLKDVLDELLKFLGLSLTIYNNEVILLDYDYIRAGGNQYWKHTINGATTTIQLSDDYTISSESHRNSNASLSLSDTFNQISIKANLYPIENVLPDFFEEKYLNAILYNGVTTVERKPSNNANKYAYLCKFYSNTRYKQIFYRNVTHQIVSVDKADDQTLYENIGCCFGKIACYDMNNKPSSLRWENMLMVSNGVNGNEGRFDDELKYANEMAVQLPVLSINTDYQIETALQTIDNKKSYLVFEGECYNGGEASPFVNSESKADGRLTATVNGGMEDYIICKLQVGNKYWNGDRWTTTESRFSVKVGEDDSNVFYNWNSIRNNVTFDMGIDKDGWAIPISNSDNLYGKINLTVYRPKIPSIFLTALDKPFKIIPKFCVIKNFSLTLCTQTIDYINDEKNDDDVKYINIIDENFVNEFDGLELKINSQASKDYSFSSVMQKFDDSFVYNKGLYNIPLNKKQLQEYNVIEKMYNHFKDTKKIISMTIENALKPYSVVIENNLKTAFVVDAQEIDYANDTNTVTLNEV